MCSSSVRSQVAQGWEAATVFPGCREAPAQAYAIQPEGLEAGEASRPAVWQPLGRCISRWHWDWR